MSYIDNGHYHNLIVGNGSTIQIQGTSHQTLPYSFPSLLLKNA